MPSGPASLEPSNGSFRRREGAQLLQPRRAPVVARRDLRRRLAVSDGELLVVLEHDVVRVAHEALAVHEEPERIRGRRAVAANAALRPPHSPHTEELTERER